MNNRRIIFQRNAARLTRQFNSMVASSSTISFHNDDLTAPTLSTNIISRSMATGTRGARGHGWLGKYRAGLGERHLQGRWHYRDVDELHLINEQVFGMNELLKKDIPTESYIDLKVGDEEPRRVTIELASAALPKTTDNFRKLCVEKDKGYKSTSVYRIEKTVGVCFGDVIFGDGTSGRCHPSLGTPESPFTFRDEGYLVSHTGPGVVSMMKSGVHQNDSRFLITTSEAAQLDGLFVAFGRVKDGMDVINDIVTGVFTKRGVPTVSIKITGAGVIVGQR